MSIREALEDIVADLKENPFDNGARGNIGDGDELIPIDYDDLMEKKPNYERMCKEVARISDDDKVALAIGYLRCYSGQEFHLALEEFGAKYPDVLIRMEYGNHDELYELLRTGGVDLVLNDQRRAFLDEYVNFVLMVGNEYIEISARNPIVALGSITPQKLKNVPCVLVSSKEQRETEREYYYGVVGFQGDFLYAENLEEARLMVIGGQGFMPVEGARQAGGFGMSIIRIPLSRGDCPIFDKFGKRC